MEEPTKEQLDSVHAKVIKCVEEFAKNVHKDYLLLVLAVNGCVTLDHMCNALLEAVDKGSDPETSMKMLARIALYKRVQSDMEVFVQQGVAATALMEANPNSAIAKSFEELLKNRAVAG
jgi:hypothetical protein